MSSSYPEHWLFLKVPETRLSPLLLLVQTVPPREGQELDLTTRGCKLRLPSGVFYKYQMLTFRYHSGDYSPLEPYYYYYYYLFSWSMLLFFHFDFWPYICILFLIFLYFICPYVAGSLSTSESYSPWWCWLALTHRLAPYSWQVCWFFIPDIFFGSVLVQWSHMQVKFEEVQRATGTEHRSLSLINLTCKELKDRLWRHSSFACDSRYQTQISPSFLGNLPNQ